MSIERMRHLEVWAFARDAGILSKKLVRQKCVDVDTVPLSDEILSRYDCSEQRRLCETRVSRLESAVSVLTPYGDGKTPKKLPDVKSFTESGEAEKTDAMVTQLMGAVDRISEIEKEQNALAAKKLSLLPWRALDIPLDSDVSASSVALFGTFPLSAGTAQIEEALKGKSAAYRKVSDAASAQYYFFIVFRRDCDAVLRALTSAGFCRTEFEPGTGTAAAELSTIDREVKELGKELDSTMRMLLSFGKKLNNVKILLDIAKTDLTEAILRERMAATHDCVLVEGWVPEVRAEQVGNMLSRMEVAYDLSEPEGPEGVPVKLKNNKFASCFEWVVSMYSLPAYGSFDPTAIMAVFYVILFATMMADAGYGLLLILGGFLGPVIMKADEGMKRAMNMFGWCGIGCLVTGVLFGGYFGDLPLKIWESVSPDTVPETLAILADPVLEPTNFLIIGIVLGFIHLVAGQVIDFCIHFKESPVDAILDHVFLWSIYAGIILIVLGLSIPGYIVAGAGALGVLLTGGRKNKNIFKKITGGFLGLYGLINFGSDLISYARILAIALSGSVLAQVFNILATMSDSPAFKFTAGILILVVGHVLNCVLSALSGFVHTSRLQYVEFFGKFYKDGGRPYAPLLPSEKFSKSN